MQFLFTEEENQSQNNATATVATISTLLIVVIIIMGIYLAVQIGYKLAKSKKRYIYNFSQLIISHDNSIMINNVIIDVDVQFKMSMFIGLFLL